MLNKKRYLIKAIIIISILIVCMLTISSCKKGDIVGANESTYYRFNDSLDKPVVLTEKPKSVVSLIGSYAETWLLAGGELSGVTNDAVSERNLILPESIKMVGTVKEPNLEEILDLSPDFVLLSADIEAHKKISETLKKINIAHAFFKVEHFNDYLNMLKICTDITGRNELYEKNGLTVKNEIDRILANTNKDINPTVLFIRAFSTGAKAKTDDNMTGKMLAELGCDNIAARHKSLLDTLSIEEVISEDPDFIFVVTMGESSEKAIENLKSGIQKNPAWNKLSAVKNDRYFILPKELFHYKPNARWSEAYEYLAKILFK